MVSQTRHVMVVIVDKFGLAHWLRKSVSSPLGQRISSILVLFPDLAIIIQSLLQAIQKLLFAGWRGLQHKILNELFIFLYSIFCQP